ncbi:multidrug effflux MFS transporter [Amycolatopsis acidicola]|uniref:Multidrug effflux MFS transporter n=1 Tax=Amycolatopsis acidicola TaxID=2596893 RepID=A0A5N0V6D5_9PSEU|nr:MFS transporter [Amycolatopsis acidicola]KAA9160733.1 multidrug effflux MFS transporter [Amycolatopsis acidicola]
MVRPIGSRGRASGRPALFALVTCAVVAPLATDLYLPGLTSFAADLGGGAVAAQASLTTFLISFSIGFLVWGPLSDRVGRRRLLIGGGLVFVVATAFCALAPSLPVFLVARAVQGLFGGAPTALSRAVVSDVYRGREAAAKFASLAIFGTAAPVLAPAIGTVVLLLGGDWRAMFWCVTAFGLVMVVATVLSIPETRSLHDESDHDRLSTRAAARVLVKMPVYRLACGITITISAVFFSYLGASESISVGFFGMAAANYGTLVTVNALSGSLVAIAYRTYFIRRMSTVAALRLGALVNFAGASVALAGMVSNLSWLAWSGFFGLLAGNAIVFPTLVYLAQTAGASIGAGGTAAAGSGVAQFLIGAAIGQFAVSASSGGSPSVLGGILAAISLLGVVYAFVTRAPRSGHLARIGVSTSPAGRR